MMNRIRHGTDPLVVLLQTMLLFFISCKKTGNLDYPVFYVESNDTGSEIKVIFNGLLDAWGEHGMYTEVSDSIVYMVSGASKTLFT